MKAVRIHENGGPDVLILGADGAGGVRWGTDVVKALALGAQAVLVGQPMLRGLAVGAESGVRRVLELLSGEVLLALVFLGCRAPVTRAQIGPASA